MKGLSLHFYMSVIMIGKANSVTPKHRVFGVAFPLQEQKKREENEFNSIYLLIYSLLSRKNQQTLGVSDNKITKKTSVVWKATFTLSVVKPGNFLGI